MPVVRVSDETWAQLAAFAGVKPDEMLAHEARAAVQRLLGGQPAARPMEPPDQATLATLRSLGLERSDLAAQVFFLAQTIETQRRQLAEVERQEAVSEQPAGDADWRVPVRVFVILVDDQPVGVRVSEGEAIGAILSWYRNEVGDSQLGEPAELKAWVEMRTPDRVRVAVGWNDAHVFARVWIRHYDATEPIKITIGE